MTVKPLSLMRWLIRLITPPGGVVLDCFLGSGSTAVAAIHEGVHFIGIEQSSEYVQIAEARIAHAMTHDPEVVKVATKKVKGTAPRGKPTNGLPKADGHPFSFGEHHNIDYADQDGMEEVEDWDCHESCPIRILGEQSGVSVSSGGGGYKVHGVGGNGIYGNFAGKDNPKNVGKGDTGTAARYFQQFPPDSLFAEVEA